MHIVKIEKKTEAREKPFNHFLPATKSPKSKSFTKNRKKSQDQE